MGNTQLSPYLQELMNVEQLTPEERRLSLEEKRLALENSFATKWFPTLATAMVPLVIGIIGFFQYLDSRQVTERTRIQQRAETERARMEAAQKDEREWGFKIVTMYFSNRDIFDLRKNPDQASTNLKVFAVVAPKAVKSVLDAEKARISGPSTQDTTSRNNSLAAVASVQESLPQRSPEQSLNNSSFTIYIQYPKGSETQTNRLKGMLQERGFRIPAAEMVAQVPSSLQVRYYRKDQRQFAEQLSKDIASVMRIPATAELVTSTKPLPAGILEVWLPKKQ
jgi:hypothetical protein